MQEFVRTLTQSEALELIRQRQGEQKLAQSADFCGSGESWQAALGRTKTAVVVLGVVDGDKVLNPAGLRMPGEFVRHKLLDIVGDLALAGTTLHAGLRANRPGHALNNQLLRKLFADPANWRLVDGPAPVEGNQPKRAHG